MTLRPVNALDIAAGHALLMAAGGVLVAEDGVPVTYNEQGESRPSACFGGSPGAVETLRGRTWRGSTEPRRAPRVSLSWPRLVSEAMLDRAAGCLFGLAIGGDLGSGMELALIVARSLVGRSTYDRTVVDAAVKAWVETGGDAGRASPLVRAVPIGLWASDPEMAAAAARMDCPDAPDNPVLAAAVAFGMQHATPEDIGRMAGTSVTRSFPWTSAVSGALAGVAWGRCVFPVPQVMRVLTWRPDEGLGVARSRPEYCWTDDLVDLAEVLLCQGPRAI